MLQGLAHPLINNVIENDFDQNMVEAAEPITRDNVELEAAASNDHYGGHYKQPDEYHGGHHSHQEYHQPHTQSQSYSHSAKHSSSEDHDHYR